MTTLKQKQDCITGALDSLFLRVISIRLPEDLIAKLKSRARKEAANRDEDYSYADLIRDILETDMTKDRRKNAK